MKTGSEEEEPTAIAPEVNVEPKLVVVDLCSGKGGFSRPFLERGHRVITVDNDRRFKPDLVDDVRRMSDIPFPDVVDCVLASPPCQKFSVAAVGHYWPGGVPRPEVVDALGIVASCLRLIAQLRPRFWVLENPTGMLRNLIGEPREKVYLCSFGARWKKPTDLWGVWPGRIRRPCGPHEPAPRVGKKAGLEAVADAADRAELPHGLGLELCTRMEDILAGRPVDPRRSQAVDREPAFRPGERVRDPHERSLQEWVR